MTYNPRKLDHSDLIFGLQSAFVSRSVHARLKVSMWSGYDLGQTVNTQLLDTATLLL